VAWRMRSCCRYGWGLAPVATVNRRVRVRLPQAELGGEFGNVQWLGEVGVEVAFCVLVRPGTKNVNTPAADPQAGASCAVRAFGACSPCTTHLGSIRGSR
jgi:hypothetical protein